jgi:hypothetical protein
MTEPTHAAVTISDERARELRLRAADDMLGIHDVPEVALLIDELLRLRSASAAPVEGVAKQMREFLIEYDSAVGNYRDDEAQAIRRRVYAYLSEHAPAGEAPTGEKV